MAFNASRGQPLATVAPRNVLSSAASDVRNNSVPLREIQAAYIGARFGLDAARARLTAELAWGRA